MRRRHLTLVTLLLLAAMASGPACAQPQASNALLLAQICQSYTASHSVTLPRVLQLAVASHRATKQPQRLSSQTAQGTFSPFFAARLDDPSAPRVPTAATEAPHPLAFLREPGHPHGPPAIA